MSARRVDPGEDIALLAQGSKELRSFARAFEKGTHSTNPISSLSAVIERLKLLKPLDEFRAVAQMAAKEAGSVGVTEDELYAHWQLAFFDREDETETLLEHARQITRESVKDHVSKVLEKQAVVVRLRREVSATSLLDDDQDQVAVRLAEAALALKKPTKDLMSLIGAPGSPFNPKKGYTDEWRKKVRLSEALAGVSRRGLDPDGKAVKAMQRGPRLDTGGS